MKIAIIGSGISGLVAAYYLNDRHEITLFEANDYVGGHTNTVDVEMDGQQFSIDTGFIVFNDWTYPNFCQLLDRLRVKSKPTEMSFSVRDELQNLEYNGHSINTLFAQRSNFLKRNFYRMIVDIFRFNRIAKQTAHRSDSGLTVEQFVNQHRFSKLFVKHYLLPMGAAIWSCPMGAFSEFPISFVAQFFSNHGLLNILNRPTWRVIEGGSKTYVRALTKPFSSRIKLNSRIQNVTRFPDRVELQIAAGNVERFDHVVFATHSDQALKILGAEASSKECEILGAFPYSKSTAILHTDESVLPERRRAWASWNFRVVDQQVPATVTYNMNILQGIDWQKTFCVTLNDESRIDPAKILRRFVYEHPLFTLDRSRAQSRHHELLNFNRTSFCGAYWRNGFHEDGVVSALAAVDAINGSHLNAAHSKDHFRSSDSMTLEMAR